MDQLVATGRDPLPWRLEPDGMAGRQRLAERHLGPAPVAEGAGSSEPRRSAEASIALAFGFACIRIRRRAPAWAWTPS